MSPLFEPTQNVSRSTPDKRGSSSMTKPSPQHRLHFRVKPLLGSLSAIAFGSYAYESVLQRSLVASATFASFVSKSGTVMPILAAHEPTQTDAGILYQRASTAKHAEDILPTSNAVRCFSQSTRRSICKLFGMSEARTGCPRRNKLLSTRATF
jgi:hypothetical protein